jgi:hypothetical protein
MIALLNAGMVLVHAREIPHVHPHEAGVALAISLVLAFMAGTVFALLKRKPAAS